MKNMRMKIIFLVIAFFYSSCSNSPSNNSTKRSDVPNDILGIWGSPEGTPVWEIKTDSIYYFGEKQNYPIKMVGKDLFIRRTNGSGFLKNISSNNDTLIFYDEEGSEVKAFRIK